MNYHFKYVAFLILSIIGYSYFVILISNISKNYRLKIINFNANKKNESQIFQNRSIFNDENKIKIQKNNFLLRPPIFNRFEWFMNETKPYNSKLYIKENINNFIDIWVAKKVETKIIEIIKNNLFEFLYLNPKFDYETVDLYKNRLCVLLEYHSFARNIHSAMNSKENKLNIDLLDSASLNTIILKITLIFYSDDNYRNFKYKIKLFRDLNNKSLKKDYYLSKSRRKHTETTKTLTLISKRLEEDDINTNKDIKNKNFTSD